MVVSSAHLRSRTALTDEGLLLGNMAFGSAFPRMTWSTFGMSATEGASGFLEKSNTFVNLVRIIGVVTAGAGRRSRCGGSRTFTWMKGLPESFGAEGGTDR
jgi:hypothetical protein